ncbi:TetR/AcrR family transcriptional regulator [Clostridium tyrobutyricum]|uniref:TetR/AcrR family transcriptional regulator n=1 Tax=Clostridium tyrobutyricum TaxID=1519 RepID=UPI0011CAF672|nr:TetR/AcrR family transcriptional regulator [Clostridium tyrobutyricum]
MRRKNTTSDMMKGYMADALLLLMAKKSYVEISISEITDRAGVNRSTFYRNFNSKDEIIKYYFNKIIYKHYDSLLETQSSIEDYLLEMFSYYYRLKKELILIYKTGLAHIILESFNETFAKIHSDITTESRYATYYHTGGIYNNFLLWFEGGMKESPLEMTKIVLSYYPAGSRPYMWSK